MGREYVAVLDGIAIIPMVWSDKSTNGSMEHCAACGRKITGKRRMVEVINGGCSVAAPGLGPDTTCAGYMGFFPVGPECAKKHFRGFTHEGSPPHDARRRVAGGK